MSNENEQVAQEVEAPKEEKKQAAPKKASSDAPKMSIFREDPKDLIIIGLDTKDGEEHPLWNERINIALEESKIFRLMEEGEITQTAKVSKRAPGYLGKKVIVDGATKTRRAREVNKRLGLKPTDDDYIRIPCVYVTDDAEGLSSSMLTENAFAVVTPTIMKAREALRLMKLYMGTKGMTKNEAIKEIAKKAFVTTQAVNQWLDVFACISEVQKAFFDGVLPASVARRFKTLEPKEQREQLKAALESAKVGKDGKSTVSKKDVTRTLKRKGIDKGTWRRVYAWAEEHKKKEVGILAVFLGVAKPSESGIPWLEDALKQVKTDMRKKARKGKKNEEETEEGEE